MTRPMTPELPSNSRRVGVAALGAQPDPLAVAEVDRHVGVAELLVEQVHDLLEDLVLRPARGEGPAGRLHRRDVTVPPSAVGHGLAEPPERLLER